jgi:hypothetical protein
MHHFYLLPLSLSLSWNYEFGPFNLQFHYSHQSSELEGRKGNPTPTIKISIPRSTWNHLKQTQLHNSKTPGLIRVRPGRPGFAGSLHWPVFGQTWTGPATGSAGSRVNPPGRSGFNNYACDCVYIGPSPISFINFF